MWRASESQQSPNIPPNLLSNFKSSFFDILEPQKSCTSVGPQVDRLIDFGDIPPSLDVNGSLLDQKNEYDLVDLYQNMYVTPQLVKSKDNETDTNDNITRKALDKDFNDFFDKLESGMKIDWTKDNIKEDTIHNVSVELTRKPKVLTPKVVFEDSDPEDLIEELLAAKNIEQHILKEMNINKNISTNITTNTKNKEPEKKTEPEVTLDVPRIKVLKVPPSIDAKISSVGSSVVNKSTKQNPNTSKQSNDIQINKPAQIPSIKLNYRLLNELKQQINTDNIIPSSNIESQNVKSTNFKVIPIKKDEKAYKDKRIRKPESQTLKYTKGADINEKSIVLPQIMSRIMARQTYLQEINKQKKRLILDAGTRPEDYLSNLNEVKTAKPHCSSSQNKNISKGKDSTPFGELNPIVLMADCNKERLRDLKRSQMFLNSIINRK